MDPGSSDMLPDFILFQLTPFDGSFVEGFGKARRLEILRDSQ